MKHSQSLPCFLRAFVLFVCGLVYTAHTTGADTISVTDDGFKPDVTMHDGGFDVAFQRSISGTQDEIFRRSFDSSGVAKGNAVIVNTTTGSGTLNTHPAIASDADGNLTVVWSRQVGSDQHIFARRYNASGNLGRDGTGDFDGDGQSDVSEFLARTDPTSAGSLLRISGGGDAPTLSGDTFTVTWDSVAGGRYQLQYKDSLTDADWSDIGTPVTAGGDKTSADDTTTAGHPQRFYRVVALP